MQGLITEPEEVYLNYAFYLKSYVKYTHTVFVT